ncbi:SLBB domain-containing protein, partial [bacterium]|nr:SLBB domain-containing protein [bacterium]
TFEEIGNKVLLSGAIWRPGEYGVTQNQRISDLITLAGGLVGEEASPHTGQIIRKGKEGLEKLISFDPEKALMHDPKNDLVVEPLDTIRIFAAAEIEPDIRYISIAGSVRRPGEYILREGMTVRDLVLRAQGLTADSSGELELARVTRGHNSDIRQIKIDRVLKKPSDPDNLKLRPMDRINVLAQGDRLLEYEIIIIKGEVRRPGPYALKQRGERLSEIIKRAGGLTSEAFPEGAVFMRKTEQIFAQHQLKAAETIQSDLYQQAVLDLQADLMRAGANISEVAAAGSESPNFVIPKGEGFGNKKDFEGGKVEGSVSLSKLFVDKGSTDISETEIESSKAVKEETSRFTGKDPSSKFLKQENMRIPIRLDQAIQKVGEAEDLALRDGDQIFIPPIPTTVSVIGAVVNPSSILFKQYQGISYYINRVGGFSTGANHARTVIVRSNGEVFPLRKTFSIKRGDVILVPPKAKLVPRNKLAESSQIAQIFGNLAVVYKVIKP